MDKDIKDEIVQKLEYLRTYDKTYQVFGTKQHKYVLEPVMSEQEVSDIEKKWNIELPKEYREFIMEVGNGGAGPAYGLIPFGYLHTEDSPVCYAKKFIHTQDYIDDEDEIITCPSGKCKVCEDKDVCMLSNYIDGQQYRFMRYQQGSMEICYEGCTYCTRLVLNGPFAGELWSEDVTESLSRIESTFLEWYMQWLDKAVETIRPYVEAIKEKKSLQEIIAIDSRKYGCFNYAEDKVKFVEVIVGMDIGDGADVSKSSRI